VEGGENNNARIERLYRGREAGVGEENMLQTVIKRESTQEGGGRNGKTIEMAGC